MFVWILDCIRNRRWPAAAGLTRPVATTPLVYAITAPLSACHVSVSVSVQRKHNTTAVSVTAPLAGEGGRASKVKGSEAPVTEN